MAGSPVEEEVAERKKKRKMRENGKKLDVGDKVELRSEDDGFQGSWHLGTVIATDDIVRRVQYDHLLSNNGFDPLIESIIVSSTCRADCRGWTRPIPPQLDVNNWSFHYGLCVDVLHNDAWWEGVVFDHEDGSEKRNVFYPDLGDEMNVGIEMLRITQDWDEAFEYWKPRGNWLFLELMEEYAQEWPLLVSVKQIWYDMRETKDFGKKIPEWTFWRRALWDDFVLQAICENLSLTVEEAFDVMDLDEPNPTSSDQNLPLCVRISTDDERELGNISSREDETQEQVEAIQDNSNSYRRSYENKPRGKHVSSSSWLPAGPDLVPGAEFCLDAISEYACNWEKRKRSPALALKARMHLAHLGWKIKYKNVDMLRMCYISPDGKCYPSLFKVCQALRGPMREMVTQESPDGQRSSVTSPDELWGFGTQLVSFSPLQQLKLEDGCGSPPCAETELLDLSESEMPPMDDDTNIFIVEPEYCPQAIVCWYQNGSVKKRKVDNHSSGLTSKDLSLKAKKHLAAVGWTFRYVKKKWKRELRYASPKGKPYYSLTTACKACMEEGGHFDDTATSQRLMENINIDEESKGVALLNINPEQGYLDSTQILMESIDATGIVSKESDESVIPLKMQSKRGSIELSSSTKSREFVEHDSLQVEGLEKCRKRRKIGSSHIASQKLQSQTDDRSQMREDGLEISLRGMRNPRNPLDKNVFSPTLKKGKRSGALIRPRDNLDDRQQEKGSKRAKQVVVPSPLHRIPRTVLSWLIDSNVVLPREKVCYISKKNQLKMAEGRIFRDGIRCNCCQKVFTLSGFEAHAGSTYHRPAACIFLGDGRSLLECQMQMVQNNNLKSFKPESGVRIKANLLHCESDYICSICHYGGELVMCDQCPSTFHIGCLGLKDVPEGEWFCPCCCCGICGQSEFNESTEQFTEKTVIYCEQCEHEYHVGCLRKNGMLKLESCPKGNFFCSKKCEEISLGLRKLLGKSIPVGDDNLSWTILKFNKAYSDDLNTFDIDTAVEHHSKLNLALSVMHECFEPVKEPRTKRDLVEDVIFSRGSELNRLNFRGFYTMLLERKDELISVATLRVFGERVAEVPLVGTRVKYRRLGMCRILMNELEKKLMELGVDRILLPAVPQVLHTWTTSFGFSKMIDSERLKFLDYIFLDFQDTIMCQKLLLRTPAVESRESFQHQYESFESSDSIDLDRHSIGSEVIQAELIEENEILQQVPVNVAAGNRDNGHLMEMARITMAPCS